ncbi:hypothetical protein [Methylohalobius crimeensis]|uniref:hypothetical protein n=1 Tax=Methylohalobius crimeensis TaxID=244365 RepID=UPI0003B72E77|nr:hypothetical protein [Methylohalobius crimeensis]
MALSDFESDFIPLLERDELTPYEAARLWHGDNDKARFDFQRTLEIACKRGALRPSRVIEPRRMARPGWEHVKLGGAFYIGRETLRAFLKNHDAMPPPDTQLFKWLIAGTETPGYKDREAAFLLWAGRKPPGLQKMTREEIFEKLQFDNDAFEEDTFEQFTEFWKELIKRHPRFKKKAGRPRKNL